MEKRAASDPRVAFDLALRFFRGDGIRQNSYRALTWMRDAAERGDLNAQKALGRLYLTGLGEMGSDPGEAQKWLSITASRGDKEASKLLKEAVEARKSEQEEYLWHKRWRSVFYTNWSHGYSYYIYQGGNNNIMSQASLDKVNSPSISSPNFLPEEKQTRQNKSVIIAKAPRPAPVQQSIARSGNERKPTETTNTSPKVISKPTLVAVKPIPPAVFKNNKFERRVALIIGNSDYQHTQSLDNPANDAEDIAEALKQVHFQVILKTDANLETMADAIYQFGEKLKGGG
jgi:hypothetical protein